MFFLHCFCCLDDYCVWEFRSLEYILWASHVENLLKYLPSKPGTNSGEHLYSMVINDIRNQMMNLIGKSPAFGIFIFCVLLSDKNCDFLKAIESVQWYVCPIRKYSIMLYSQFGSKIR